MKPAFLQLQEVAAPAGWTAVLLQQDLPVDDEAALLLYRSTVTSLLERLSALQQVSPEEVLLLFDRLRPGMEIETFRRNARWWLPEFGVGVWLHQDPPATWTTEEFEAAPPGTLRPPIERLVRVQPDVPAQLSAWRLLLGSGALVRTVGSSKAFLAEATEVLHPTITDPSLTSFPFYVPLLGADTLTSFAAAYDLPLETHLPGVDVYLRESVEDGGLFVLARQSPEAFWNHLLHTPLDMDVLRISSSRS